MKLSHLCPIVGAIEHYRDIKRDSVFLKQRLSEEDYGQMDGLYKHPKSFAIAWEAFLLGVPSIIYLLPPGIGLLPSVAVHAGCYMFGAGLMRMWPTLVDTYQKEGKVELTIPVEKTITIR